MKLLIIDFCFFNNVKESDRNCLVDNKIWGDYVSYCFIYFRGNRIFYKSNYLCVFVK